MAKKSDKQSETVKQIQNGLEQILFLAYPKAEKCEFYPFYVVVSDLDNPILEDGTIAMISKLGSSKFDKATGKCDVYGKYQNYSDLIIAVHNLVNAASKPDQTAE